MAGSLQAHALRPAAALPPATVDDWLSCKGVGQTVALSLCGCALGDRQAV